MEKQKKEICVICGKKTNFDKKTPVQNRLYYVEGCGQLCRVCFAMYYMR